MVQRTVLKVDISCQKCKKKLLKSVSSLEGVDKIEVDEAKGTLTVTGNADPYEIVVRARKSGKFAEVVTIGPPPKQDAQKKPEDKKSDEKKPEQKVQVINPQNYPIGERMTIVHVDHCQDPTAACSIM